MTKNRKKILLEIPFFKNNGEGIQCMQVAMQVALKYYLGRTYSLKYLDKLTGRKKGYWTYTPQIASSLDDLGLKVEYYSSADLSIFLGGRKSLKKHYGKDADKILKFTDIKALKASISKLIAKNIFKRKKLPFSFIEKEMMEGALPLMLIDYNKIAGIKSPYQGHFVAVVGFDKGQVYYHESGPKDPTPSKKVSKSIFIKSWNSNGTDNDVVIVSGKK